LTPPPQKFFPGDLVRGVPYSGGPYVQHPMTGIIIRESSRSNWWGETYTRWYDILAENGKIVQEIERHVRLVKKREE